MFVHGEQADTILASLLALMASLQSLSRCFLVRLSLVQHGQSSSPSLKPQNPSSYSSFTPHIQKKSVRGKTLSSPRTKLQREVTQTTVGNLYSLIRRHRMSRRTRCHYPYTNLTKPTIPCSCCQPTIFPPCNTAKSSFSVQEVRSLASYRITSNLLR